MSDPGATKRRPGIPFPLGWYSWDLGKYRPSPFMYWVFDYGSLPPLPAPDPRFRFLEAGDDLIEPGSALDENRTWLRRHLVTLTDVAARQGLTLPDGFTRFMRSPELQASIGSGCWGFILSNQPVPCPGLEGSSLVGFLREQQDCVIWCLCLTRDGQSCVVAVSSEVLDAMPVTHSETLLGYLEPDETTSLEQVARGSAERIALQEAAVADEGICVCDPSFPSFIQRFWIENEIRRKLNGDGETPLTDAERRYVEHYARQRHYGV